MATMARTTTHRPFRNSACERVPHLAIAYHISKVECGTRFHKCGTRSHWRQRNVFYDPISYHKYHIFDDRKLHARDNVYYVNITRYS